MQERSVRALHVDAFGLRCAVACGSGLQLATYRVRQDLQSCLWCTAKAHHSAATSRSKVELPCLVSASVKQGD